ncbi:MAG TPA: hypothetical protein VGZ23_14415 [bacterium]|nr:hypothetical protein [bacterium]
MSRADADLQAATRALLAVAARVDWGTTRRENDPVIEAAIAALRAVVAEDAEDTHHLEQLAMLEHNVGRLNAARALYARVNELDPPRFPTDPEREAVERFCPVTLTTRAECFELRDCAAVHHPADPIIGYHLFWEDDWDYPDDDEPSDHEIVWVRYRPSDLVLVEVATYFHGRVLTGGPGAAGARPTVLVQWGKHGSLPEGWEHLAGIAPILRKDFEASRRGGRVPDHPRKRRWPSQFSGEWPDYVRFERAVDPLPLLRARTWYAVGRWANAILHDDFVPYNFHAKREWPHDDLINL